MIKTTKPSADQLLFGSRRPQLGSIAWLLAHARPQLQLTAHALRFYPRHDRHESVDQSTLPQLNSFGAALGLQGSFIATTREYGPQLLTELYYRHPDGSCSPFTPRLSGTSVAITGQADTLAARISGDTWTLAHSLVRLAQTELASY
jgi:hypothetical protein